MGQTGRICPKCGGLVMIEFEGDWPDQAAKVDCDLCGKASKFSRYKSPETVRAAEAERDLRARRKEDQRIARRERKTRIAEGWRKGKEEWDRQQERHRAAMQYETSIGSDIGIFVLGLILVFAIPVRIMSASVTGGNSAWWAALACFLFVVAWLIRDNTKALHKLRRTVDQMAKRMEEKDSE